MPSFFDQTQKKESFFANTQDPSYKPPAPARRNIFSVANDTAIEIANAFASGLGAASEFVVPNNSFSQSVDEFVKTGEESQSDVTKASKEKFNTALSKSETVGDELSAVWSNVKESPLLMAGQAVGSIASPFGAIKAAGIGAKALGLGEKGAEYAGRAAGVGLGGAMSGGDAAGSAYDLINAMPDEKLLANAEVKSMFDAGMNMGDIRHEIATNAARKASIIPALIGGVSGAFGMEKILAGAKLPTSGIKGVLATGLSEGLQEAVDEGSSAYTSKLAAKEYDTTINEFKGLAANSALGFVLGAAAGAGAHGLKGIENIPVDTELTAGAKINEASETQYIKAQEDLKNASTVDEAISAFNESNNLPIFVPTQEDIQSVEIKRDELRSLVGTPAMRDFVNSIPSENRQSFLELSTDSLNPNSKRTNEAAEQLHALLSENGLFEVSSVAPSPVELKSNVADTIAPKNILELKSQVAEISSTPEWKDHMKNLPMKDRVEASEMLSSINNPKLPASYRTTLAEVFLDYSARLTPQVRQPESMPVQQLNPIELIAQAKFEPEIGKLNYVETTSLPDSGDGLTKSAAESIQKLSELFGKKTYFFNQTNAQRRLDGYANPDQADAIFVNVGQGDAGWHYVAGHEFFHQLTPDIQKTFIEAVKPLVSQEKFKKLTSYINQSHLDDEGNWAEIGADLFGNRFGEPEFLGKVLSNVKDTNTLIKLVTAIREFVTKVLQQVKGKSWAADKYVSDLVAVRDAAQQALKAHLEQMQNRTSPKESDAAAILDEAQITGKERIEALKDVKSDTISINELRKAYPSKVDPIEAKRIAEETELAYLQRENQVKPDSQLKEIIESGQDAKVDEAIALTDAQGFDEDLPTATQNAFNAAISKIASIPNSKRTALQRSLYKTFGNSIPKIKPKNKAKGISARDKLRSEKPFLAFIAEFGIDMRDRSDVGGEKGKNYFVPAFGSLFRKKGLRLDELAHLAHERGFLTESQINDAQNSDGVNKLAEMIQDAMNGVEQQNVSEADFQEYNDNQLRNTAIALGIDIKGKSLDRLAELVNMHYDSMDAETIARKEAQAMEDLAEISDELIYANYEKTIENLLEFYNGKEPEIEAIDSDINEPTAIVKEESIPRRKKKTGFIESEVERILDIAEENRTKAQKDFLIKNENKRSSERKIEIDDDVKNKMLDAYNSNINDDVSGYLYDTKTADEVLDIFGDIEDVPDNIREDVKNGIDVIETIMPNDSEYYTKESAPSEKDFYDDARRESNSPSKVYDINSMLDENMNELAVNDAFKVLAESEGWNVGWGSRYFDISKGDVVINVRISDHANTAKGSRPVNAQDININLAPSYGKNNGMYYADTFESALWKMQNSKMVDGELYFGGKEASKLSSERNEKPLDSIMVDIKVGDEKVSIVASEAISIFDKKEQSLKNLIKCLKG